MFRRPDIDTAAVRINYRSVVSGLAETVYCPSPPPPRACVQRASERACVHAVSEFGGGQLHVA